MRSDIELVIAVDPGAGGAIAWQIIGFPTASVEKMPETRGDTIALFKRIVGQYRATAIIEDVVSFIPDGGASMMFNFGANVERPACILQTLGIPIEEVRPQKWQKALSLGNSDRIKVPSAPRGASPKEKREFIAMNATAIKSAKDHNATAKRDWKNKLKERAQLLYPEINATLHTCDALLILTYALNDNEQRIF